MTNSEENNASLRKLPGLEPDAIPKGFTPINKFHPEDIFIVGWPKSGNTWFQNLVAGVIFGVDPRLSPPKLVHDIVPDVHYHKFYRRYSTPMFFKSHFLPLPEYRRVVYLLRDGRDALVSYRHYLEATQKKKIGFSELTAQKLLFPCPWREHVEAWERNPYDAQLIVIKYEDLLRQPVEQLERFCRFSNLTREREYLKAMAEAAQFRNLRSKEGNLGFGRPDLELAAGSFFFRRGVAGSHTDEMPPDVLTAFLEDAGETLRRHGYLAADPVEAGV